MNNNTKEANAIKYDEIDTKLVIVCHCSKPVNNSHKQLYYVLKYEKLSLQTDEAYVLNEDIIPLGNINKVSYVNEDDKLCPKTDNWVNIADNSKTYVWGVHCPIYWTLLEDASNSEHRCNIALTDILVNAYKVLENDGKVIFTCSVTRKDDAETDEEFARKEYDDTVSIITANLETFMQLDNSLVNGLSSKYSVSIIKTNEFDFLIGQNNLNAHNYKPPPPDTVLHRYMHIDDICVIFTKIVVLHGGMSAKKRNNTQNNKKKKQNNKTQKTKHKKHKTQNTNHKTQNTKHKTQNTKQKNIKINYINLD